MNAARRKLEEIAFRYNIEPELRGDIYVEGPQDKAILEWYLEEINCNNVKVYDISTVDVPRTHIIQHGLDTGSARGRVIGLATYLMENCHIADRVSFLIDKDYDGYIQPNPAHPDVVTITDINSLGLICLNHDSLTKFTTLIAKRSRQETPRIAGSIISIARFLYAVRVAQLRRGENHNSVKFTKSCTLDPLGRVLFNRDDYIIRYVQGTRVAIGADDFKTEIANILEELQDDLNSMNDHDLIVLLKWYQARSPGRTTLISPEAVADTLKMSLTVDHFNAVPSVVAMLSQYCY